MATSKGSWHASKLAEIWAWPGGRPHKIARVKGPRMEADARLMAAAPDLLDSLRECLLHLDIECGPHHPVRLRADAAIRKATGETPC